MVEVYSLLLMAQNFKEYDLYTPILLLLFFLSTSSDKDIHFNAFSERDKI